MGRVSVCHRVRQQSSELHRSPGQRRSPANGDHRFDAGGNWRGFMLSRTRYAASAKGGSGAGVRGWSIKPDGGRVGSAQQHRDPFAWRGEVFSRQQGGERGGAAGFHDDPQRVPQRVLRRPDRVVGHEDACWMKRVASGNISSPTRFGALKAELLARL